MYYNAIMVHLKEYLELDNSYKTIYIRNNKLIREDATMETLFYNISSDVDIILNLLNIPASRTRYRYWKDAVFITIMNSKFPISICNEIYPAIAMKYHKTGVSVERAMRVCFEDVLYNNSKRDKNFIIEYLNNYLLFPHNSELLSRIVELVVSKKFQDEKVNFFTVNNQK